MAEEDPSGVCAEETYEAVYQELAPKLQGFLYYRTKNVGTAADMVQESFLRLWENCRKVTAEKAGPWLFRVADNLFLKSKEREKVARKYEWRQTGPALTYASPQEEMEEKEFQAQLEAALEALPDGAREVFLLNRMEGLKYREIAELLGISQKAVEKRMHRALVTLRDLHPSI